MPSTLPYGTWLSPIRASDIASGAVGLSEIQLHGGEIFWLEMRPTEGGRSVVVRRRADGMVEDCLPSGFNARTRVHEYGGGSYVVAEALYFSHFTDQRVYRVRSGQDPEAITPPEALRFADYEWDAARQRLLCVREDHRQQGEPQNTIVSLDPKGCGAGAVLVSGRDFYAAPRLSPDGSQLAWLTWSHPAMPWDAAELWVAPVHGDGSLGEPMHVAGGAGESALEPLWSPSGDLLFASDRTDWWNLYRFRHGSVEWLTKLEAEFATPAWVFGMRHAAFESPGTLVCAFTQQGTWKLAGLDIETRALLPFNLSYTDISAVQCNSGHAVFLAGAPDQALSVVRMDLASRACDVLRSSLSLNISSRYLSSPEAIEFPTAHGRTAHGLFYPPKNDDCRAPDDERPPLVVMIHGGPTSATSTALRLNIQYYTSRGVAVLDANYGGSTGYGRAYRERLNGEWGVVDVDDCCAGARYLAVQGRVDGRRLAIRGGSAGGYTTLACLAFRDVFAAGASHYGVSDCEILAQDTHKFESRYLDTLIGPYPARRDLYRERSPIHHLDGLRCPVIFFQGLDDKVVPPNQAEMMVEALRSKGVLTAYVSFPGEQHGFRKAENICRAIEAEFAFFAHVFGFRPVDTVPPIAGLE